MSRKWRGRLTLPSCAVCCLLACSPAFAADPSKDLIEAFKATYQQAPPLIRTIREPISEYGHPNHITEALTRTAVLAPARLIKLYQSHYALLVSEAVQNVGHAWPGAFSISYLHHGTDRTLEQLWPELTFMGETGIPADETWEAHFWSEPLVLASSTYCGMGGCQASIAVFALGKAAPRLLGTVPGSAESGSVEPGLSECKTYRYIASISAPASKNNVLSVRYRGWTAPPGSTKPKHWFRRKTDYAVLGNTLVASPKVDIPDCGK